MLIGQYYQAFSILQGICNLQQKQIEKGIISNFNKSELINKKIQDLGSKIVDEGNNHILCIYIQLIMIINLKYIELKNAQELQNILKKQEIQMN